MVPCTGFAPGHDGAIKKTSYAGKLHVGGEDGVYVTPHLEYAAAAYGAVVELKNQFG